jgi:hypothetical protein
VLIHQVTTRQSAQHDVGFGASQSSPMGVRWDERRQHMLTISYRLSHSYQSHGLPLLYSPGGLFQTPRSSHKPPTSLRLVPAADW